MKNSPEKNLGKQKKKPGEGKKQRKQPKLEAQQTSVSNNLRKALYALVGAGVLAGGIYLKNSDPNSTAKENGHETVEHNGTTNYAKLAQELEPYGASMDPENQQRFQQVITLLKSGLNGVEVNKGQHQGDSRIRALARISGPYDSRKYAIDISENWSANNGVDLSYLVHEIFHIAENLEGIQTLDKNDWKKRFASPGTGLEIRSELAAWEMGLVFADSYSGGLFEKFAQEIKKLPPQDGQAAELNLQKYIDLISKKLHATDEKSVEAIKTMLKKYYLLKHGERENLGCKWSYNYVTNIATLYSSMGAQPYEINMPKGANNPNEEACVYPLTNGPYLTYRPYIQHPQHGMMPSPKSVKFGF